MELLSSASCQEANHALMMDVEHAAYRRQGLILNRYALVHGRGLGTVSTLPLTRQNPMIIHSPCTGLSLPSPDTAAC